MLVYGYLLNSIKYDTIYTPITRINQAKNEYSLKIPKAAPTTITNPYKTYILILFCGGCQLHFKISFSVSVSISTSVMRDSSVVVSQRAFTRFWFSVAVYLWKRQRRWMYIGMPQPMKKPTTAPSKDRIRLTSMFKTPTNVADKRNRVVKPRNSLRFRSGLFTKDRNYLRVRKNRMGRTEKFWNKMPHCTILPITKNIFYYTVSVVSKQSKIVEQSLGCSLISIALGEQVKPPTKPTQKYTPAVSMQPSSRSLSLFLRLILFFRIGAAVGCIKNDKANAPATLEKSGSNSSKCQKLTLPSAKNRIKLTAIKMAQTITQQIEYLINLSIGSISLLYSVLIHTTEHIIHAHCIEYTSKVISLGMGQWWICWTIAAEIWKKFVAISRQYAMHTKKRSNMFTRLLRVLARTPPIRRIDSLKLGQSVRLWITNSRHVMNWMHPTTSMMRDDPMIPSFRKSTGQTITADPIIVFVRLRTVLAEVSVPVSLELLSTLTRYSFSSYDMNLVFLMASISAYTITSSSATFILFTECNSNKTIDVDDINQPIYQLSIYRYRQDC